MLDLQRKVVLITGAAGGIGVATATAFAEQGAHLALVDINASALQKQAQQLREMGTQVSATVADLATASGVKEGIREVLQPFLGRVDVLVSNAGVLLTNPFEGISLEEWRQSFMINFFSHVVAVQAVLPAMKRQGGTIIVTGSDQGIQPDAELSAYAAAKAALHNLTKSLAREFAPFAIRVNAVAPGMTRTPLVAILMEQCAHAFGTDPQTAEILELKRRQVLAGRLAEPEEIAQAMIFLATNNFMTGSILDVSGGNVRGL